MKNKQGISLSNILFNKMRNLKNKAVEKIFFKPYPYQKELADRFNAVGHQCLLYVCWCRRAGKDQWAFAQAVRQCLKKKNSRVIYIFPTAKQGKLNILDGVTFDGKKWISSVVNPIVLKRPKNGSLYFSDNSIKFKNGSQILFYGDDGDSIVGGNVDLLVISEAALVKKSTLEYTIPAIWKIGGNVICVSTPRYGSWFNADLLDPNVDVMKSILNARQIYDNDGNPIYTKDDLARVAKTMSAEKYASEYECDLNTHNETSIYGKSIDKATFISPFDLKDEQIFISADLGASDNSAYVFCSFGIDNIAKTFHHYRSRGEATQHYINYVNEFVKENNLDKRNITIILPQDATNVIDAARYLTSRAEYWREAEYRVVTLNHVGVLKGIEVTRAAIINGDMQFVDTPAVRTLLSIVKGYEWKTTPKGEIIYVPKHGTGYAASNDADAMEYMNIALFLKKYSQKIKTESGVIIDEKREARAY